MTCMDCGSRDTDLFRGEDGHFRKECASCGYVAGPFVTRHVECECDVSETLNGQTGLGDFT